MVTLRHALQVVGGTALIVAGGEHIGRLARPDLVSSWLGWVMIVIGTVVAGRASYRHRKSALLVGLTLLGFAGLWAWNLHYFFDPSRVPPGFQVPRSLFAAPTVLILLGTVFAVFWRYVAPVDGTTRVARGTPAPPTTAVPQTTTLPEASSRPHAAGTPQLPARWPTTAWYRLLLLACSAALALLVGRLAGVEGSERAQIITVVLVLGCVASGLISEDTLSKIISRQK